MLSDQDDERRRRELELVRELQPAYADALLAGSPRVAEAVVREAIAAGLSEATIDDEVIGPALRLVGDLWAGGQLSIADEHLATAISLRVLTLQREAFRTARQRASQRILLAGAPGELHVIGLMMAASLILAAGYDVRLLGADVPLGAILEAVDRHDPAVVGFTTATSLTAAQMPAVLSAVRDRRPETAIVVGGRAVDEAWAPTWGIDICRHVADAVQRVDALVQRAPHN